MDNDGQVRNLVLPKDAKLTAEFDKDLLGGVVVVKGEAQAVTGLDDEDKPIVKPTSFVAVPYCTWDNRKPGPMVVWLPERPELAEPPGDLGVLSNGVRVRASHVWQNDTLAAVNDGATPKNSNDQSIRRQTWWDHRGTEEWIVVPLHQSRGRSTAARSTGSTTPASVSAASRPSGGCCGATATSGSRSS